MYKTFYMMKKSKPCKELYSGVLCLPPASPLTQLKNLPADIGDVGSVRSLSREDALEKEMATHASILAWEIPRTEEAGGLQSMGPQRVRHN